MFALSLNVCVARASLEALVAEIRAAKRRLHFMRRNENVGRRPLSAAQGRRPLRKPANRDAARNGAACENVEGRMRPQCGLGPLLGLAGKRPQVRRRPDGVHPTL